MWCLHVFVLTLTRYPVCLQTCTNNDGGFTCGCTDGYILVGNGHNCTDIDACSAGYAPCSNGAGNLVNCTDLAAPALGDADGRVCYCPTGWEYIEGTGCVGGSHHCMT